MPVFLTSRKSGEQFAIDKAIVLIGRHPDCDIVLDENPKVSRRHCCVAQVNNTFLIRDLGSMNGVRVNNEQIRKEAKITSGDEIAIGDVRFLLEFVEKSEKASANSEQSDREPAKVLAKDNSKNGKKSQPRPISPVRNIDLSQSIPIPLEEEDKDFAVEDHSPEKSTYLVKSGEPVNESVSDVVIVDDDQEEEEPDEQDRTSN